jgi:hypothetical protein
LHICRCRHVVTYLEDAEVAVALQQLEVEAAVACADCIHHLPEVLGLPHIWAERGTDRQQLVARLSA